MIVKKKLLISFSGGRTSGFMMWWLMNKWEDRHNYEIVIVFANTGKEVEGTLEFVRDCQVKWNLNIIWVEARHLRNGKPISKKGWQVDAAIVDFETASRKGEPFEEMISILGIPSTNAPFCSDQLKRRTIESFLKTIGWHKHDFYKAIGIRLDEPDRITKKFWLKKIIYPLMSLAPSTKKNILDWWNKNDFDLSIDEDQGNCDNCWKKDFRRLARNTRKYPSSFNWWKNMEILYGHLNPRQLALKPPFNFFRGNINVDGIFKLAELNDRQLDLFAYKNEFPRCGESCEAF